MIADRREVRVRGTVQGVGFRPFVHRLATSLQLAGSVRNTPAGVVIEVAGDPAALDEFARRLIAEAPPLARITSVETAALPPADLSGFHVIESVPGVQPTALIPPDVALCEDCARELADPADRRFEYAFTNCTNCGPRFTIVTGIPYDRPQTTMSSFTMCADCAAEYRDPTNRRFHAEPVACPACGPALSADGTADEALARAAAWLAAGEIVAIKGLGGYHLACDARSPAAVETLRARKGRGEKPFAVMVRDLEEAHRIAHLSDRAVALLTSAESPIVIAPARAEGGLAPGIAPGQRTVGLMLPYTPLHRLLLAVSPPVLVMTSGNLAEEPIIHQDEEAARKLVPIADHSLSHNREIAVPCDDSVVRVSGDLVIPIRRARGYVPRPVQVGGSAPPVLAVGGYHKGTFCLLREGEAILSQHIGDLDTAETMDYFGRAVAHFARLFQVTPEVVAHDLHPGYLSTQWAQAMEGVHLIGVQHHHAHIASVMAEAGLEGPVIGISYDGTGYGTDGTVWGGEILIADRRDFRRALHLRPVPLPGGEAAVRHPARMALSHLASAFAPEEVERLAADLLPDLPEAEWRIVLQQLARGLNSPLTSSMGRLFDAVAVLLSATPHPTYEGQPAMELEAMAEGCHPEGAKRPKDLPSGMAPPVVQRSYPFALHNNTIDPTLLLRALVADLRAGVDRAEIAARFHETVVSFTVEACRRLRAAGAPSQVALSGGVMQNALLVSRLLMELEEAGFQSYLHREVPPNDGGLSLGQAVVAAARVTG
jgi:hydrogenase maturation protein HypF